MNITKIEGKLYNITDFKHPGGEMAKWHAQGRDSTVLFKSHHPMVSVSKLQSILEKHQVDYESHKHLLLKGEDN
jgi:cytochrome b involved in lipid metabolism